MLLYRANETGPLKGTKQKPTIRYKIAQTAKVSTPPREGKGAEGVHIHILKGNTFFPSCNIKQNYYMDKTLTYLLTGQNI